MIIWPLVIRWVALPVPMTAGIPYSRAMIEPCAKMPPTSVTRPRAWAKRGVQAGVVVGQEPQGVDAVPGEQVTLSVSTGRVTPPPAPPAPPG